MQKSPLSVTFQLISGTYKNCLILSINVSCCAGKQDQGRIAVSKKVILHNSKGQRLVNIPISGVATAYVIRCLNTLSTLQYF